MLHYLVKRLLGLLPTLFLVAVIVFLFVHMLPGDPARLAAGPEADQVTVELVRKDLGLDKPLPEQFSTKRPVSVEIGERFAATFWLTVWSMVWSVFFGLIIGMISATKRNKWQDHAGMALAVSGISFPTFALGLLLMEIFSVSLGWLPTVGADSWKHYILPSITLGAGVAAVMARFTRASFVEILQDDYIRTARAKGLSGRLPARRFHRGRKGIQLARPWPPARGCRGNAGLSGSSGRSAPVFARIHPDQPAGGYPLCHHQPANLLQVI